jgi:tetratricopeptide (TPR) repeat protein
MQDPGAQAPLDEEQPAPEQKGAEGKPSAQSGEKAAPADATEQDKQNKAAQLEDSDAAAGADPQPAVEIHPNKPAKPPGKMPTEALTDPQYFYDRAQSFAREGEFQSALNYINRALELSPNFWEAWFEKGLIFQLSGYDGPAARRYLALIEHRPDMIQPHIALGTLYRKHNNTDLAEKEYRKAIELNFYSFSAHYNLANLLMDMQRYENALKEYKICLKLKNDDAMVHNNLGVIYQHKNYLDEAAEEFEKASHLDPANKMFAENLTNVRARLSRKTPRTVPM